MNFGLLEYKSIQGMLPCGKGKQNIPDYHKNSLTLPFNFCTHVANRPGNSTENS